MLWTAVCWSYCVGLSEDSQYSRGDSKTTRISVDCSRISSVPSTSGTFRSLTTVPYTSILRRKTKPEIKLIKIWPEEALDQLWDCFSNTKWNLFEQEDLEEYTKTVLFYIFSCVDTVTVNNCYHQGGVI
ncbi:hypothetical protein E2320_002240, partial [Naja naja]